MSNTIVIAQIGTSAYHETEYRTPGASKGTKSNYTFEAVTRYVLETNRLDSVDLILVATKDSSMGAVYEAFSGEYRGSLDQRLIVPDKNGRGGDKIPTIDQTGVRNNFEKDVSVKMSKHFSDIIGRDITVTVAVAIIEYGIDSHELQENFDTISTTVENVQKQKNDGNHCNNGTREDEDSEWDIYFDISNGFRSFPIYIYTLTNYFSRFNSEKSKSHLFYGMYEAKNVDGSTPLIDLQVIDDMMQLINAINEFQNCGSVVQIRKLLGTNDRWNIQIGDRAEETLSYAFELFDYGTNANNLSAIMEGISLLSGMGDKVMDTESLTNAEKMLLMDISDDFAQRFPDKFDPDDPELPYATLTIRLAEWYHKQGREGNAAITIQEAITTFLMEHYPEKIKFYLTKKGNFPEEANLRDERNLFSYKWRDIVVKEFRDGLRVNDSFHDFHLEYEYIRKNVRNVAAHSLLCSDGQPKEYRKRIGTMIQYMKDELEAVKNGRDSIQGHPDFGVIIEDAFKPDQKELALEQKNIVLKMLENIDQEVQEKDSFAHAVNKLREQLQTMRDCRNFEEFYKKRGDLDLLFSVLDDKIKREKKSGDRETYRVYFDRNKENKRGYERLINYWKGGGVTYVIPILKERC